MSWEEILHGGPEDDSWPAVPGDTRVQRRKRERRERRVRRLSAAAHVLAALLVIAIVIAGAAAAWFVLYAFAAIQSFVIVFSFILEAFVCSGAMT